ncbi:MAG: hypothetical protein QOH28_988, partial [Actinomycetota bacterium]|nr:hypothetical protein [Actinomycetota bacterium]
EPTAHISDLVTSLGRRSTDKPA